MAVVECMVCIWDVSIVYSESLEVNLYIDLPYIHPVT